MKTMKTMKTNERGGMADDADNQCDKRGAGDRIVMIPAIQRYWVDGVDGWSMEQIEDGSWVRYDDHVAAMESMRLEVEKLNLAIEELKKCRS